VLTPRKAADGKTGERLLSNLPRRCIVHAGRAYGSNRIGDVIEDQGAVPKRNLRWEHGRSTDLKIPEKSSHLVADTTI
jgi:hypothetical protein